MKCVFFFPLHKTGISLLPLLPLMRSVFYYYYCSSRRFLPWPFGDGREKHKVWFRGKKIGWILVFVCEVVPIPSLPPFDPPLPPPSLPLSLLANLYRTCFALCFSCALGKRRGVYRRKNQASRLPVTKKMVQIKAPPPKQSSDSNRLRSKSAFFLSSRC